MEDGTVLIVAGCLLGFVAGCLVCAEVFFACGARASAWAYRAGRREACEECREHFAEALKERALGGPSAAKAPEGKGNERGALVSKVWIRKRDLGLIPAGETLQQFRSRYYADRKEAKLARYREELPRLREELAKCGWKHGERQKVKTKIAVREIALGIARPRKKKTPGEMHGGPICWHMEHPDDLAPLCLEREPGDRHSPAGWKTTANWRHVTCMDCLALRGTDADPQKGRALEEKSATPCCGNCAHWVPANSQALGGRFFGVCTARAGERIATEAGASCSRWTEEREEAAADTAKRTAAQEAAEAETQAKKEPTLKEREEVLAQKRNRRALELLADFLQKGYKGKAWAEAVPEGQKLDHFLNTVRLYGFTGDLTHDFRCQLTRKQVIPATDRLFEAVYDQARSRLAQNLLSEARDTLADISREAGDAVAELCCIIPQWIEIKQQAALEVPEPKALIEQRKKEAGK